MRKTIGKKVINVVSDVLSFPARKKAKKAIVKAEKEEKFIKSARKLGYRSKREGKEIIAYPKKK